MRCGGCSFVQELVRSVREWQNTEAIGVLFSSILDGPVGQRGGVLFSSILDGPVGQRGGAFVGRSRVLLVMTELILLVLFDL